MNSAVLEVATNIAESNNIPLRDVITRFRKVGIEFRTETNHSFTGEPKEEQVLLGYAYQGLFYPYTEEENRKMLEGLVVSPPTPAPKN
ncbi:MAG: hypothetical protein FJX76_21810 [Armatimonadetes bacterium]|nr:hypothetical protein [Armatimonadota bacterium]